ncbi:hypothetical protein K470DRAFT_259445 [Piedraia hortae CBS 480.64]|uniref:histidine kinase n=1 Tax=Piedraia hortae CBS 480.64 TaxID=1314780 RepID=A0A6A7BU30_9PEZI|nr:hypothetical protein K470DRAFT_259445 [Piedraia hortae CBS 480.64]
MQSSHGRVVADATDESLAEAFAPDDGSHRKSRPLLIRSPPARLSELEREHDKQQLDDQQMDEQRQYEQRRHDDAKVAILKEAVHQKVSATQCIGRRFSGQLGSPRVASPMAMADEGSTHMSPPVEAWPRPLSAISSFSGQSQQSHQSTESTDSSRTVRPSGTSAPADPRPLKTPSYPFPTVPSTPRSWSAAFHQPFTTLSPTVLGRTPGEHASNRSFQSTPGSHSHDFMPGQADQAMDNPQFPTPNLYDLVLALSCDPGMEQWWTAVVNMMHDEFKADRVSLVVPSDPTDIENVPWGQKATFSMNGREEYSATHSSPERPVHLPSWESVLQERPGDEAPEKCRPRLPSRHTEPSSEPVRPAGPRRTVTHVPTPSATEISPARRPASSASTRHTAATDPEFSNFGDSSDGAPYAEVFATLHSLDHEERPLVGSCGIIRVLERGRVVTVTREYDSTSESSPLPETEDFKDISTSRDTRSADRRSSLGPQGPQFPWERRRGYEEYEQYPTSPWAQSPAPSPAIQIDEDANPFFPVEDTRVEDSFAPTTATPRDYSQFAQVEAIGVDKASTVIHIPLVHPTLSQPMQSFRVKQPKDRHAPPQLSNTLDLERKSPIAILSLLSSTVPYPSNLTRALELLAPHLATSFSVAQQFSSMHIQNVSIKHRRTTSGHIATAAPMVIAPTALDYPTRFHIEEFNASTSGSIASPSDYSGRSRHSPMGSVPATPVWDSLPPGWSANRSRAGTPLLSGSEIVDSYFEAKKRGAAQRTSNGGSVSQVTPAKPPMSAGKGHPDDAKSPHSEQKHRNNGSAKDERSWRMHALDMNISPTSNADVGKAPRSALRSLISNVTEQDQPTHRHSLLHSYGADFEASFGTISSAHMRNQSFSEDMPPPSERLLRTIIDAVPVQIFTAKPNTGQISWVNSKFLVYRAQEPKQVLKEPWQAIHPNDRLEFLSSWNRSLRSAQQLQQKVRLQRFDGSFRWFYVRAAPLKDRNQRIVHWIGTMMDFHEQHLAELNATRQQETAASEAKYRALANSSPQIVFAVNRAKGVIFCNSQWVHYSDQAEAQALGLGFMNHVHPGDLSKCALPLWDDVSKLNVPSKRPETVSSSSSVSSENTERPLVSPGTTADGKRFDRAVPERPRITRDADGRPSYSTEVRLRGKEGDYRWFLVRVLLAEPMLQNSKEEEIWYGTCTDINDHKTLERDLKTAMDEKSRFLSNMSHEIRTPLNGIMGMVNFLIDSNLSSEQMEHVNIIRSSTEGLRGLINDILDLSKAEAGMIQLSYEWLYIRALIEEVNDLTSALAIDKGLELNYTVEGDVPAQVKGDRFRIRQVLLNIIGNAIKFTDEGEVFVRCSLMPDKSGQLPPSDMYIKFEVVDTGRGFTEKEADHLFKRFSQIDGSSTRQHGGTGLGLVISRQLVQLHGGDLSAKSAPGKGSTFAFYIRTTVPSDKDKPPYAVPTPPPLLQSPEPVQALRPSRQELSPRTSYPWPDSALTAPSSGGSSLSLMPTSSVGSTRSSASSVTQYLPSSDGIELAMPSNAKPAPKSELVPLSAGQTPPMYSIMILCPLKYSRQATVTHIDKTLPRSIPHQITSREHLRECEEMLQGDDPVRFTHIVAVLKDIDEIIALINLIIPSPRHSGTSVIIITDLAQRRKIMEQAPQYDYERLSSSRRLQFVFKPLKPSRFAVVFDPHREREMSTDRNQDSAQQVAFTQKQVFEEMNRRLGGKGKRVLLVEDNRVNQIVISKFMSKSHIELDTVSDGVQCTQLLFSRPHDYYSVILCDLFMPNKDGYQTCTEIRTWERENRFANPLKIVALSANVLGDVQDKCVEVGFDYYLTKPVEFGELGRVLLGYMDG